MINFFCKVMFNSFYSVYSLQDNRHLFSVAFRLLLSKSTIKGSLRKLWYWFIDESQWEFSEPVYYTTVNRVNRELSFERQQKGRPPTPRETGRPFVSAFRHSHKGTRKPVTYVR